MEHRVDFPGFRKVESIYSMIGDRTLVMVKGPSLLGANLGLMICHLRFLASNQTLSPLDKGVKH